MSPEPHLHVIEGTVSFDSSTGEICSRCAAMEANMALAIKDREAIERELRMKRRKIDELMADKERQAETHPLADKARTLYWHHQIVNGYRKSLFTTDRFWEVEPWLRRKQYGVDIVRRAIDGAAFQSWCSERSNGSFKIHNEWSKILKNADSIEEHANRAPKWWTPAASVEMESWPRRKPTESGAWYGIRPPEGWKPPATTTQSGQTALLGVVDD